MKYRLDFVSNSSSCSFIVISAEGKEKYNFNYQDVTLPNPQGRFDFGWDHEQLYSIWSKLNFCAIQLIDLRHIENKKDLSFYQNRCVSKYIGFFKRGFEMLKEVCATELHLDINLLDDDEIGFGPGKLYAYIDHQSSIVEGKNMEMFSSRENLVNFLTSSKSYIETDNDNSRSYEEDESDE